jgi:hypothetical protein
VFVVERFELDPLARTPTGVGSVIILCGRVGRWSSFEIDRTEHSETGMPPLGVVPAFYPLEDGVGKFSACFPGLGVENLELQGASEGFHHRVVVALSGQSKIGSAFGPG